VRDQRPDSVAAPTGEVGDRGNRAHNQITLLACGRAEVQTRGEIGDHPGFQFPVRDRLPQMWLGRPSGDGPAHGPYIVARLVRPCLTGFRAGPRDQPEVITLQQSVQSFAHVELERPQSGFESFAAQHGWCPPGSPAALLPCRHHRLTVYLLGAGAGTCCPAGPCGRADTCGNGTVCSTRLTMWSTGTPSANAS